MSQTLPAVSLSSVSVGQTGIVDLKNVGPDANPSYTQKQPHLVVFNESGVGLLVMFQQGGDSFYLPAGGWHTCAIVPGESQLIWQVQYILNVVGGAPVSQLLVTYYGPNEQVPNIPQLGNSPIGGSVGTSAIQTLSQEGNAKPLLTIDIGDSALANLINIFNDGTLTMKVDVAGVAHTVLQILATANFLRLGQAGDIVEALGQLKIDQLLTVASQGITVPAATNLTLNVPTGQQTKIQVNATDVVQILGAVVNLLKPLNITITPITVNGTVSGSASMYQIIVGSVNFIFVVVSNYNSVTNPATLAFPTALATGMWFMWNGVAGVAGNGGFETLHLAGVSNINVLTSIAAAGGGAANQANIFQNSFGIGVNQPIDTLALNPTTSALNGCLILIGI